MKFKIIVPQLVALLLPQAMLAFASTPGLRAMRRREMTDTGPNLFLHKPTKLHLFDGSGGRNLKREAKRCPANAHMCDPSIADGCCRFGEVCGIYHGSPGCCPDGLICTGGPQKCPSTTVDCKNYCCAAGTTCELVFTFPTCVTTKKASNNCSLPDYSKCNSMNSCCPTGFECVSPNSCRLECEPGQPPCGGECCDRGYLCRKGNTCELDPKYSTSSSTTESSTVSTTQYSTLAAVPSESLSTTTTKMTIKISMTPTPTSKNGGVAAVAATGVMAMAVGMVGGLLVM